MKSEVEKKILFYKFLYRVKDQELVPYSVSQ